MLVFNRTLFCVLTLFCIGGVNVYAQRQLPGEGELPRNDAADRPLPSEEMLPGEGSEGDAVADLPGEDLLPGGAVNPGQQDLNAPIAGITPYLRLAFDGHTGLVRTLDLDDGGRTLVTGGEDKDLHVWRRTDLNATGWLHHKTIRWPVARGQRGRILQARLRNDLVAFGGTGAAGASGELRIVNVASGELVALLLDEEDGALETILSLAWSTGEKPKLLSLDMTGQVNLWQPDPTTGRWVTKIVVKRDTEIYGQANGTALMAYRRFGAVAFAGDNHAIVARYVYLKEKKYPVWKLMKVDLRTGMASLLDSVEHIGTVSCISSTPNGSRLLSSGFSGKVGIWDVNGDGNVKNASSFTLSSAAIVTELDQTGKWCLACPATANGASLEVWDVGANPPRLVSSKSVRFKPVAGAIDTQGNEVVVSSGNDALVFQIDEQGQFVDGDLKRLEAPVKAIQNVAFARDGSKKIAFGWAPDQYDGVFDLTESKLLGRGEIPVDQFVGAQQTRTRWTFREYRDTRNIVLTDLIEGENKRGTVPTVGHLHGEAMSIATVPVPITGTEEDGEVPDAGAVLIGTRGRNNIYAYRANDANPPELLRQFRGHLGAVLCMSASADGQYLVSGSNDTTICVWNLQEIYSASKMVNRWGCEFEVEGGQLIATEVREYGPLYFRGVRSGDRLDNMQWFDADNVKQAAADAEKMRAALLTTPFDRQVVFSFSRMRRPLKGFQSFPAWRPLAQLFVDQSRQWAFWSPAGYYNASFNGHQLFGWQINPKLEQQVEYYRAAQFRKQLERPDVMRNLLAKGSLTAAMRATVAGIGPPPADQAIVSQVENTPKIRLRSPDPAKLIDGDELTVTAEVEVPLGATLVPPKAFVSGVPSVQRRVIANAEDAGENVTTYEWKFRLPSDSQLQLEVLAATEAEALDRLLVNLNHKPSDRPRQRRLHVLAIGASKYRDPQIQSLDFAALAAKRMSTLFRVQSSSLYETSADALTDSQATRPMWRVFAQNAADDLQQTVSPDDLVVMYLCGHGLRDRRTNQWYFVTADARYNELMNDQYDDCIAFSDLSELAKLPCRKLAILDSCHSGAVQPVMRREDLKSALRFLQDDVVLTLTASEGDEEAAEKQEAGLGRFTTRLVEALEGAADANGDGEVVLNEAIEYVTRTVSAEAEEEGMPQHPTASPAYLLQTLRIPLTATLEK